MPQNIEALSAMMAEAIAWSQDQGATATQIVGHCQEGFSVDVREASLESLCHEGGVSFEVVAMHGQAMGTAHVARASQAGLRQACEKALYIAKQTESDDGHVLPDVDRMAWDCPRLELCHPWDISVANATELGISIESQVRATQGVTDVEAVSVNTHLGTTILADSQGFLRSYQKTFHSISVSALAEANGIKQRDGVYALRVNAADLPSPQFLASLAAERVVARLHSETVSTVQCPVLFTSRVSPSLIAHFLSAISGYAQYYETTFLKNAIDSKVWVSGIHIHEHPHAPDHLGARPFDGEGVLTRPRPLVEAGILKGYLLDTYTAKKLEMPNTGHAGGAHALSVQCDDTQPSLEALIKTMGRGLVVTELIGDGVNAVTGDYSRGVAGFWVENGMIQKPVHELTIASNLKAMYQGIIAMADDATRNRSIDVGSLLIESMTIAGH